MYNYENDLFDSFFTHDLKLVEKIISSIKSIDDIGKINLDKDKLVNDIKNDLDNVQLVKPFLEFWDKYYRDKLILNSCNPNEIESALEF